MRGAADPRRAPDPLPIAPPGHPPASHTEALSYGRSALMLLNVRQLRSKVMGEGQYKKVAEKAVLS